VFTIELPREIGSNGLFDTLKYGKDRIYSLEAPAIKGKRSYELLQLYGIEFMNFHRLSLGEKAMTRFDPYVG